MKKIGKVEKVLRGGRDQRQKQVSRHFKIYIFTNPPSPKPWKKLTGKTLDLRLAEPGTAQPQLVFSLSKAFSFHFQTK